MHCVLALLDLTVQHLPQLQKTLGDILGHMLLGLPAQDRPSWVDLDVSICRFLGILLVETSKIIHGYSTRGLGRATVGLSCDRVFISAGKNVL